MIEINRFSRDNSQSPLLLEDEKFKEYSGILENEEFIYDSLIGVINEGVGLNFQRKTPLRTNENQYPIFLSQGIVLNTKEKQIIVYGNSAINGGEICVLPEKKNHDVSLILGNFMDIKKFREHFLKQEIKGKRVILTSILEEDLKKLFKSRNRIITDRFKEHYGEFSKENGQRKLIGVSHRIEAYDRQIENIIIL